MENDATHSMRRDPFDSFLFANNLKIINKTFNFDVNHNGGNLTAESFVMMLRAL